jgi:hypothetical protein
MVISMMRFSALSLQGAPSPTMEGQTNLRANCRFARTWQKDQKLRWNAVDFLKESANATLFVQ